MRGRGDADAAARVGTQLVTPMRDKSRGRTFYVLTVRVCPSSGWNRCTLALMGAVRAGEQQAPMQSLVNWALLGLVIERPSYAYELAQRFERTYEGVLSLSSISHVYTALGTLRDRSLVEE